MPLLLGIETHAHGHVACATWHAGMRELVLSMMAAGFAVALPMTWIMRAVGVRAGALDGAGVAGQVKAAPRRVPNTGGVAIFLGVAAPMAIGLAAIHTPWAADLARALPLGVTEESLESHLPGLRQTTPAAAALLLALLILHVLGVIDDRKPLGPGIKMAVMALLALGVTWFTDTRLFTVLDAYAGGSWASIAVTVAWIVLITNAMNFLDNMDGLCGGVGVIASGCFLVAALGQSPPQWFIGAALALLVGSLLGFLCFNFPWREGRSASIFMGDGGSLVVGFLLGFLTVRTTFYAPDAAGGWYGVFMPLVVLAIPLYDLLSVCTIRISQGRSPFVGDLQHFSHRLVKRGLTRRDAVLVICGLTGMTSIGGIWLGKLEPWQAILVGVQTMLALLVLAVFESRARVERGDGPSA
ncbi:MAG: MraY family glycosyltransferase [Phycisphaerales bacterium]